MGAWQSVGMLGVILLLPVKAGVRYQDLLGVPPVCRKPKTAIGPFEGSSFLNVSPSARMSITDLKGRAGIYVAVSGHQPFSVQTSPSVGQEADWSEIFRLGGGRDVVLFLDEAGSTNGSRFYRCVGN